MRRTNMTSRRSRSAVPSGKTIQLGLFPLSVQLRRIQPSFNEWRYYGLSVQPDLFGGAALVRNWGRIGTAGTQRVDLYPDEGTAVNALTAMIRYRLKRGYIVTQS
ncbi:WGR domain-containing protein [Gluconacetobacter entanii]|nr:WGR domain-containing protein [Gluconacetobacter entanii]